MSRLHSAGWIGGAAVAVAAALVGVVVALPGGTTAAPASSDDRTRAGAVTLPDPNVPWDYQIGGAFTPHTSVGIVSRDRNAAPSAGDYNVCYVNAYQTQPDEKAFWRDDPDRWALVLKDGDGRPVVDGAWGEWLLDTRTATKRDALIAIVGRWIDGCAADGFDAAEFDNLDSWNRSKQLVTREHNKAFARLLTARAHTAGLAAAQKNWVGLSPEGPGLGFDLAVAEQCGQYRECQPYADAYDDRVLVVEYGDRGYDRACTRWGATLSIVRRNVNVTPSGPNRRC